ncbi:type-2 angiotensin II receptor-like [Megalops cyprinoides]|uniref:type-2 angiotensin II receptor-like n=1 Tax=Megalops cyprinoides TaxID=118141 RepID=UPI001865371C|nr:type-2 angiotensin II receptor-like [Megalops cyprinoides]
MAMATVPSSNLSTENTSLQDFWTDPSCSSMSPPQHQSTLIPAIYSVIFILGFIGNGLVVFVLSQKSSHRTVANTYLLNLALSDLLFLCSLPFWAVYYSLDYDWVFGTLMCKVCGWLLSLNVYASIFFITCMSVDRCLAIVYPFQSQSCRNLCRARLVSCLVWAAATLPTIPTVVFRDTHPLEQMGVTACVMHYPSAGWFAGMALLKNLLGFLVPFAVITCCYCNIGWHLMAAPTLDEGAGNLDRVLRMVAAVVLAFFVCWFPFHVLTFLDALGTLGVVRVCWVKQVVSTALPFTLCLGFSNSAVNPFVYCFVGNHFREQLTRLLEAHAPGLSHKTGSISSRLSSFSRKLSDLKDLGQQETVGQHKEP